MLFDEVMFEHRASPYKELRPQAILGSCSWDLSESSAQGPVSTKRPTLQEIPFPYQQHAWVSSMSAYDNTAPTPHVQPSRSLSDHMKTFEAYDGIESQVWPPPHGATFLHGNTHLGPDYLTAHQMDNPQPTRIPMTPVYKDNTASLSVPTERNTQSLFADNAGPHTIGYMLEEEGKKYVFKCSDFTCSNKSFGRWTELKRHYEGAHAVARRTRFWCEVYGCDRSEAFGSRPFPRKDKLGDHVRKVHHGLSKVQATN